MYPDTLKKIAGAALGLCFALSATAQPSPRSLNTLCYDPVRDVIVLFGGNEAWIGLGGQLFGDTWELDGHGWRLRAARPPPWPGTPVGSAFDPADGAVRVYKGNLGPTWDWDGTVWTERIVQDLGSSFGAPMAYDERRGVVVLHGGWPNYPNPFWSPTWEWDGTGWTLRSRSGPPCQFAAWTMVYDSARGVCVVFGDDAYSGFTFEWDGFVWRTLEIPGPNARYYPAMAYDSWRGATVLFGGMHGGPSPGVLQETWEYSGQTWRQVATNGPSPRVGHNMTFDSRRGVTVLFGGWDGTTALGDTWQWDGTAWSPLTRCYADCDTTSGQHILDIFDFLCFQNRYAAGAPYACDCDTSGGQGVCDVFDFLCFQNAYAAGCP